MAISGITVTNNNGVDRITTTQTITGTATATGETLVLDGSASTLETGTSTGSITLTDCAIIIDTDTPTGNDASAVLNYGGRTITTTTLQLTDCQVIIVPLTTRHNIQVTGLLRTKIIESDNSGYMFVYTKGGGNIIDVLFKGINVWEVYAAGNFVNITVDSTNYGYLNWEAGRLDFFGFAVNNIARGHLWIGTGSSTNACWHWNNDISFDNEKMYITAANNRYYEGYTASWRFIDQITLATIQDVVLVFRDDMSGSQAIRGTYITNSSGHLVGTYDSQNRSSGSSQERPVLFMLTAQVISIDTGSPGSYSFPTTAITGDAGNRSYNYDIDIITPAIEVRAYGHLAPSGFKPSDTFIPTTEIGKRASDGSVEAYQDFVLSPDTGVTATKAVALAYTTLTSLNEIFDRIKAEWVDTNDYPLPIKDGLNLYPGSTNLAINGSAASAYAYTSGTDTITLKATTISATSKFTAIVIDSLTLSNGADISGINIIGNVTLTEVIDLSNVTITGNLTIQVGGTYNFSNVNVTGNTTNSGSGAVTINLTNGSSLTTTEPGTGSGQVNLVNTVPIKVTVKDAKTLGLIQGARVYLETATGGPLSAGTVIVNDTTDVTGEVNTTMSYKGDQPIVGKVRKATP